MRSPVGSLVAPGEALTAYADLDQIRDLPFTCVHAVNPLFIGKMNLSDDE